MDCNMHPTSAREWPSPDGSRKAVEYRTVCPGWYALTIDIPGPAGRQTAFTARPVAQRRPPEWPQLNLEWKAANELWITYPGGQDTTCISRAAGLKVHCLDAAIGK